MTRSLSPVRTNYGYAPRYTDLDDKPREPPTWLFFCYWFLAILVMQYWAAIARLACAP